MMTWCRQHCSQLTRVRALGHWERGGVDTVPTCICGEEA